MFFVYCGKEMSSRAGGSTLIRKKNKGKAGSFKHTTAGPGVFGWPENTNPIGGEQSLDNFVFFYEW